MWHIIPGEAGCEYAADHGCAAIVVDALRASATAAVLLDRGARELIVVGDVETARRARAALPGAVLLGERGGLPPEGFDGGNSPRLIPHLEGRVVVFTTTTGAGRLVAASGAPAAAMGTTVNASAAARWGLGQECGVVVILKTAVGGCRGGVFPACLECCDGCLCGCLGGLGEQMRRFWRLRV